MITIRFASLAAFALAVLAATLHADDWPGFRGNRGGVSADKDLPAKLSADNILWKVKLPGPGTASPIVHGDKIFIAAYSGYGTTITKGMSGGFGGGFGKGKGGFGGGGGDAGDQSKLRFHVLCFDRITGKKLWQADVQPKLPEQAFTGFMREHGYASSTLVTDGERVYAFFGRTGVVAFDMAGKQVWQTSVGTSTHMWGTAASPILHGDLVIVNAAIESKALVALNKATGKEVWRHPGIGTTWASPVLVETKDGKHEIVLNLPGKILAVAPASGKELWTCLGIVGGGAGGGGFGGKGGKGPGGFGGKGGFGGGFGGGYTASTPVAKDGVVYLTGGGGPTPTATIAIKTGGRGDVSKSHVLWKAKAGANSASPVIAGDCLYLVDGVVTCLKLSNGETVYKERLYAGKNEYVSPVAAADRVFALTRNDGLFIVKTGDTFERLAHYDFKGDTSIFNASPAIADGRLYVRSNENLYCIGAPK